mmetsp:Transcript_97573/g.303942  ORF Transcript_97573/g.303942 Transcript_97573/m.303942 type:complete len:304 (+) Transcript_97573:2-913(+)
MCRWLDPCAQLGMSKSEALLHICHVRPCYVAESDWLSARVNAFIPSLAHSRLGDNKLNSMPLFEARLVGGRWGLLAPPPLVHGSRMGFSFRHHKLGELVQSLRQLGGLQPPRRRGGLGLGLPRRRRPCLPAAGVRELGAQHLGQLLRVLHAAQALGLEDGGKLLHLPGPRVALGLQRLGQLPGVARARLHLRLERPHELLHLPVARRALGLQSLAELPDVPVPLVPLTLQELCQLATLLRLHGERVALVLQHVEDGLQLQLQRVNLRAQSGDVRCRPRLQGRREGGHGKRLRSGRARGVRGRR